MEDNNKILNGDNNSVKPLTNDNQTEDINKEKTNVKTIEKSDKFKEKANTQVNKILKDLGILSGQGAKSELTDEEIDNIISELRETTNLAKKQFEMSIDKKDNKKFGVVNNSVNKTIKEIKVLGELAEKHSGEYIDEHIKIIFEVLKKKTNEVKKELKSQDKKDEPFSL